MNLAFDHPDLCGQYPHTHVLAPETDHILVAIFASCLQRTDWPRPVDPFRSVQGYLNPGLVAPYFDTRVDGIRFLNDDHGNLAT
jgi:hypothetical protein